MRYYSDKLNQAFNTVEELIIAESNAMGLQTDEIKKQKEKMARDYRASTPWSQKKLDALEDITIKHKKYLEASWEYRKAVAYFTLKYGNNILDIDDSLQFGATEGKNWLNSLTATEKGIEKE